MTCRYCPSPTYHPMAVTCADPVCRAKRRADNTRRSNSKNYASRQTSREAHRNMMKVEIITITRRCACGREFTTPLTREDKARWRFCLECREIIRELEAGAMW